MIYQNRKKSICCEGKYKMIEVKSSVVKDKIEKRNDDKMTK